MNRDENNTLKHVTSSNPFGAPAAQMVGGRRTQRTFDPRWNQENPDAPMLPKQAPEAPRNDENDAKTTEIGVEQPVEQPPEPKTPKLKTLRPPSKLKKEEPAAPEPVPEPRELNPIIESRSPEGLPSYRCEFEGRDIMVGFPCYKTTNPITAFTLLAMALDFGRDKIRFDMSIGDAMIYHSRNVIADKFLQSDAKWLLMMDDDIIPSIGRPAWMRNWVAAARNIQDLPLQRHVLHRLIGSGKTLIGGAYFGRQEGGPLMCSNHSLTARAKAYEDTVVPVDWVATGCLLVHRTVFEDIAKKYPELAPKVRGGNFDYFHPMSSGEGEDVSFCKRAAASGHQPHIDLGLPVFHVGYKIY